MKIFPHRLDNFWNPNHGRRQIFAENGNFPENFLWMEHDVDQRWDEFLVRRFRASYHAISTLELENIENEIWKTTTKFSPWELEISPNVVDVELENVKLKPKWIGKFILTNKTWTANKIISMPYKILREKTSHVEYFLKRIFDFHPIS